MVERKLFKTRMCVLYQKGRCSRPTCSFAHGDAELRRFSNSYSGKRNYRDGDLRDKLGRKQSPERSYSPGRDARDHQILRGHSPLSSIGKRSDRNRKKKQQQLDGHNDVSESLKTSNEIEDRVIEGRTGSSTSKSILEDQLKELRSEIKPLIDYKHELDCHVEEKIEEAGRLSSQIEELESQLVKEKEECKRITSRIRKFIKAHNHCTHLEDDLKRSQARLQKLGEHLGSNISGTSGNEENSNINIVSDGETTRCRMSYPPNEIRTKSSPSKKRLHDQNIAEEPISNVLDAETTRMRKRSRWSELPTQSNIHKENGSLDHGNSHTMPLASNEKLRRGNKVPISTSTADKLKGAHAGLSLPSTSMAAHAFDDDELLEIEEEEKVEVSGLPFLLPLPPPTLPNGYSRYEGNDQLVDIDGLDEEMVHVDII